MNICITGALGHIGSGLIRNLNINFLDKVFLIDNLYTQRYASLFDLPVDKKFQFFQLDIFSDEMIKIIENSNIVVHLAAITDAESSFQNRDLVFKINYEGTKRIADLCKKCNVSLMFFSTTSVYGPQNTVVDEECSDLELRPQSPYAESKLMAEKYLLRLTDEGKLNCIIFRLGTIFGYSIGMRFHTAVNKFVWQAVTGQRITVWKTAFKQRRPYCGLNDCINAVNYVINQKMFNGQIYNIVTDNFTVEEIIGVIKEFIPDIKIKFVDSPIMNQLSYYVSNKKSLDAGFRYTDNIRESIGEVIFKLKNVDHTVFKQNLGI